MFGQFGEFGSAGEINEKAAGQLCTPLMAAFGKLLLEQKDLETGGELEAWAEYIKEMCVDEDGMTAAVRQKDKKLSGYTAASDSKRLWRRED